LKRFHFNLEKILDLRKYREQETELELGRAIGELTVIEGRIADLARERSRAAELQFSPGQGGADIFSFDLYIRRLDHTRDKLLEAAAQAELKVEKARALYIEASRERKILDKLKDKREREYRKTIFAAEVKALDDISGGTAARKRTAGILA
jgi:flagellar FliJ protein